MDPYQDYCRLFLQFAPLSNSTSFLTHIFSFALSFSMEEGVETAFMGTRSGLMRFQRYAGVEKRVGK